MHVHVCVRVCFLSLFDVELSPPPPSDVQNFNLFSVGVIHTFDSIHVLNCNFGNAGIIPTETVLIVPSDI